MGVDGLGAARHPAVKSGLSDRERRARGPKLAAHPLPDSGSPHPLLHLLALLFPCCAEKNGTVEWRPRPCGNWLEDTSNSRSVGVRPGVALRLLDTAPFVVVSPLVIR